MKRINNLDVIRVYLGSLHVKFQEKCVVMDWEDLFVLIASFRII